MFGGLAFLIRGNMAIAASCQGGAMVRVARAQSDALVATTKARATAMWMRNDLACWRRWRPMNAVPNGWPLQFRSSARPKAVIRFGAPGSSASG
jgi:hypothetical protein